MPLQFNAPWRFEPPTGDVPTALINEFSTLIAKLHACRTHRHASFACAAALTIPWN